MPCPPIACSAQYHIDRRMLDAQRFETRPGMLGACGVSASGGTLRSLRSDDGGAQSRAFAANAAEGGVLGVVAA